MKTYHKIQSVWFREPHGKRKLIDSAWSKPEFAYLAPLHWCYTEKVDGTNIRVIWKDGELSFNGKTDNAQMYPGLRTKLESLFSADNMKEVFPDVDVCLYGEGYGEKIQSGGNYTEGQDFVLFDALIGPRWLSRQEVDEIALKLDIKAVPIVGKGTLHHAILMARNGFRASWGDFPAEGLVCRPLVEMLNSKGERIITKVKHKDF